MTTLDDLIAEFAAWGGPADGMVARALKELRLLRDERTSLMADLETARDALERIKAGRDAEAALIARAALLATEGAPALVVRIPGRML